MNYEIDIEQTVSALAEYVVAEQRRDPYGAGALIGPHMAAILKAVALGLNSADDIFAVQAMAWVEARGIARYTSCTIDEDDH